MCNDIMHTTVCTHAIVPCQVSYTNTCIHAHDNKADRQSNISRTSMPMICCGLLRLGTDCILIYNIKLSSRDALLIMQTGKIALCDFGLVLQHIMGCGVPSWPPSPATAASPHQTTSRTQGTWSLIWQALACNMLRETS